MDRAISEKTKRKRRNKVVRTISVTVLMFLVMAWGGYRLLGARVKLSNVHIAMADCGDVERSLVGQGVVEPFYREVVTAPVAMELRSILVKPGDRVSPSDTLVIPAIKEMMARVQSLQDEVSLKKNRVARAHEEKYQKRRDLMVDLMMDSIHICQLEAQLNDEKYLFKIGGGSRQRVEQAEIACQMARLNNMKLQQGYASFEKLQKLDVASLSMELSLKQQQLLQIKQQLSNTWIRPAFEGLVARVMVTPGERLIQGQALLELVDATRFKVEGEMSARYANRMKVGMTATIKVNQTILSGALSAIYPMAQEGVVKYSVKLKEPENRLLRPGMRVEVRLVQSVVSQCVRIPTADYYFGEGYTELFVLEGDKLVKRKVRLGGAGFNYVEVIEGIASGEEVVISKSFNEEYKRYNSVQCGR